MHRELEAGRSDLIHMTASAFDGVSALFCQAGDDLATGGSGKGGERQS
jgi:hypothetical protein